MEFRFFRDELANTPVLSVDGISPKGPNLSHWPGNRTPAILRHDLSTGIVLRFAALPKKEREEFLQGVEIVTNNHYDTDGFLSVWAALYPEKALRVAQPMLHAAEAGDFSLAPTPEAVKLDLIVEAFANPSRSPIGLELWSLADEDRYERAYRELIGLMPRLLEDSASFKSLWKEPFARFESSHEYLQREGAVRRYPDIDLAVIESDRELDRRALQTAAQSDRALFVRHSPQGNLVSFWYAVTSWFDLVTIRKPSRLPLDRLAQMLDRECPGEGGRWIGESIEMPVAHLFFGETGTKDSLFDLPGKMLPHPSLTAKLEETFVRFFRSAMPPGR